MKSAATAPWVVNRPTSGWLGRARVREVWAYRELAIVFAWRETKLRYKQTLLGIGWVLLQPLIAMILFTALLERAVGIPSEGVPYPVFAYVGLAAWTATSTAVSRASESLIQDSSLVTKVYFPRILAPIGVSLPMVLDLVISLLLAVPLMAVYGVGTTPAAVLLPLCVVWLAALAVGVGIWAAALNVLYRDVRYAMTFGLQAWLLATPVFYPSSLVSGDAQLLLFLNPAAGPIEALRGCLLGTPVDALGTAISLAMLTVITISGLVYFHRVDRVFADRI